MKTTLVQSRRFGLVLLTLTVLPAILGKAQPANDLFADAIVITGTNVTITGTSLGATQEAGEPYLAWQVGGASVWWTWTAPFGGFATISTAGSDFDTLLGIFTGSSVSALSWLAYNDDENANQYIYTSKVLTDVAAGQTYQIAVDGFAGDSGNVWLEISLEPFPVAPTWALPDPHGATVHSSDYEGKVVIFDFWATWCNPCKAEIPDYVLLQDKYRADGLEIIGPSLDSTSQAVLDFMATNSTPLNYQIIMSDYALEQAYGGVSAIPTTFIIDRQGIVRKRYVGTQSRSTFENDIIPLLYGNTRLTCQQSGNQMLLLWRTNATPFTLEFSTDPTGSTWLAWPTAPTVVDGTNTLAVPTVGSPRYFRLNMSY